MESITSNTQSNNTYIWFNGEFIIFSEAKIHVLTHSLHYASAVFEGEKVYNGTIFKLEAHIKRLIASAKAFSLNLQYTYDQILEAHYLILKKNNLYNAYIRPLIWQGSESLNMFNSLISVNLLILSVPSSIRKNTGLSLHLARWRKPHPNSLPSQVKSSGHYNMSVVCQKEARALGFDDALMLDWEGYIAECTTSNIFFVKKDILFTPIADRFLNGITRQTIIEIAQSLNISIFEIRVSINMLQDFTECFITGTAIEVKGIESITIEKNKINFTNKRITNLLRKHYINLVSNKSD